MKKETRTEFINRVLGLNLGSIQGKYSYCSDEKKQVLFSLNLSHGETSDLILSHEWSKNGYAHSLKHIDKILKEDYELLVFKTKTAKNGKGETRAVGFEPIVERRRLIVDGKNFRAAPIEAEIKAYEEVEKSFREKVIDSLHDSSENRLARLATAATQPVKRVVSTVVYNRNPDVVAEALYRAKGQCEGCLKPAPFNRKTDDTPYLEVHHIKPLAEGGDDTLENTKALCPNCHRKAHHG